MKNAIPHTIYLQDGTALNIGKRIAKRAVSLKSFLAEVPDNRKRQGKRHPLVLILLIIFVALLRGSKDLKDACLFARINQKLFKQMGLPLLHGIPNPTTISRALAILDPEALVTAFRQFLTALGIAPGDTWSFDGKTMRAASGENAIRHILSFFSHQTHLTLGQIGVDGKENEIPAFERLLDQGSTLGGMAGKLLLGDALHTQRATVTAIVGAQADYLLVVKGNQRGLRQAIQAKLHLEQRNQGTESRPDSYTYETTDRKRTITTTVTAMTVSPGGDELTLPMAGNQHWTQVRTAGMLHRTGTRVSKDGKTTKVDEIIAFISSRVLTAQEVAIHLRAHWCIENNLHWVKDEVLREDRHTLRTGKAPQIMSFLRSMCISLCSALKLKSISDTIHNLEKSTPLLGQFLRMAAVM